jgi:hypothetical protein
MGSVRCWFSVPPPQTTQVAGLLILILDLRHLLRYFCPRLHGRCAIAQPRSSFLSTQVRHAPRRSASRSFAADQCAQFSLVPSVPILESSAATAKSPARQLNDSHMSRSIGLHVGRPCAPRQSWFQDPSTCVNPSSPYGTILGFWSEDRFHPRDVASSKYRTRGARVIATECRISLPRQARAPSDHDEICLDMFSKAAVEG